MTEDTIIIIGAYLLSWFGIATFAYIGKRWRNMSARNIVVVNVLVQIAYSALFFYLLRYESAGGTGLLWFLLGLSLIFIQTIINFGSGLVVYILGRRDQPAQNG